MMYKLWKRLEAVQYYVVIEKKKKKILMCKGQYVR